MIDRYVAELYNFDESVDGIDTKGNLLKDILWRQFRNLEKQYAESTEETETQKTNVPKQRTKAVIKAVAYDDGTGG